MSTKCGAEFVPGGRRCQLEAGHPGAHAAQSTTGPALDFRWSRRSDPAAPMALAIAAAFLPPVEDANRLLNGGGAHPDDEDEEPETVTDAHPLTIGEAAAEMIRRQEEENMTNDNGRECAAESEG